MTLAEPGSPNPVIYPAFRQRALRGPLDLLYDPHAYFGNRDVAQGTPDTLKGVRQWAVATTTPGLDTRKIRSAIDMQHAITTFLDRPLAERTPFSLHVQDIGGIRSFTLRSLVSICVAVASKPAMIDWLVLTFRGIPAVGFGMSATGISTGDSIALTLQGNVVIWWEPESAAAAARIGARLPISWPWR